MRLAQAKKSGMSRAPAQRKTQSAGVAALTHAELDQARALLSREIQLLQAENAANQRRLDQAHDSLFRGEPDEIDQSTGRIIFDEGVALTEQVAARLISCRHALERIEGGSYGTCEECQQAIDPHRLAAMPRATTCLVCASLRSRRARSERD